MVDDGGRGDCLPCAGRALDQSEGALQDRANSVHLRGVQLGQVGRGEAGRGQGHVTVM